MSLAKQIKEKLSLRDVARLCRIELPERDKVKFRAPFRPDQTPSCTIFHDRVIDWSTGERIDPIELYALAKQVTTKQAIGELARHLGLNGDRPAEPIRKWPSFDKGTQADANAMIKNRGFSLEGIRLARDRGLVRFGKVCGVACVKFCKKEITDKEWERGKGLFTNARQGEVAAAGAPQGKSSGAGAQPEQPVCEQAVAFTLGGLQ